MEANRKIDGARMSKIRGKITDRHGNHCWYDERGLLGRANGPAVEYTNGDKVWYRDGKRHRLGGPAMENKTGKYWYRNGDLHREDGPAIERNNGTKEYWYKNEPYPEIKDNEDWERLLKLMILK